MRKLLLLIIFITGSAYIAQAQMQVDTIFKETFDAPSFADSVYTSDGWIVTNASRNLYTSPDRSFYRQAPERIQPYVFTTAAFETEEFVFLDFNHIAKIRATCAASIQVSKDSGQTWTNNLNYIQYRGSEPSIKIGGANPVSTFNDFSYLSENPWNKGIYILTDPDAIPTNSWWKSEKWDLSGLLSDTVNHTGVQNAMIRFSLSMTAPAGITDLGAGWFIDDIVVTTASCELEPPEITWNLPALVPCFFNHPQGRLVQETGMGSGMPANAYRIALRAIDTRSGIDSVVLYYRNINNGATPPFIAKTLPRDITNDLQLNPGDTAGIYRDTLFNVLPGDTIEYYVMAWDKSCPNVTKSPALGNNYVFWVEPGLPSKCGSPNCNKFPQFIDVPKLPTASDGTIWREGFEGNEWVSGNEGASITSAGNAPDNSHRGQFLVFPDGAWQVSPSVDLAGNNDNSYAWSIADRPVPGKINTGPNGTAGGLGLKYLYTESRVNNGTQTILVTPCINLTEETRCLALEFDYHMFGSDIDRLIISIDTGSDQSSFTGTYRKVVGAQQTKRTDPWKNIVLPLEDFNGQYIRVRINARRLSASGHNADFAIDNFRLFKPKPADMEILEIMKPKNGYCYYGQESIQIAIRNSGCQTPSKIPVGFIDPVSGTPVYDTIHRTLFLGDTLIYTLVPKVDLSNQQLYNNIQVFVEMPGDSVPGNNSLLTDPIEHYYPITTFPFIEDFEDGGGKQTQVLGNDRYRFDDGLAANYRWLIGEGLTPSYGTGPFSGFNYGGKYLYTESGGGTNEKLETYFRSVCVDLSTLSNPAIAFYYHVFSDADVIDQMYLQVSREDEDLETWTTIPGSTINGVTQSRELDDWKLKVVDLSAYKPYLNGTIKLRFVAKRKKVDAPDPGEAGKSDAAIDNVSIFDRLPNDAGSVAINKPNANIAFGTSLTPEVKLANFGSTALTSVPVDIIITPLCGTNMGVPTTYSTTITTNIPPGGYNAADIPLTGANIVWPLGEFQMCIATALTGDNNTFNDTVCRNIVGHDFYNIATQANFDSCDYSDYGFYISQDPTDTTYRQWELGKPSGTRFKNARSPDNAWVTNLDGPVSVNTDEYLYTPYLDNFDTIVKSRLEFFQIMDLNRNTDDLKGSPAAGTIEYLDSATNTWKNLGVEYLNQNVGTNWYFGPLGALALDIFDGNPGFVGATNSQWLHTIYPMNEFNYVKSKQKLRFHFKSRVASDVAPFGFEGWGIDDFEIYVPPQNSASPIKVKTSDNIIFPQAEQWLSVTVRNTGAKNLDDFEVEVFIDGVSLGGRQLFDMDTTDNGPLFTNQKYVVRKYQYPWKSADVTVGKHDVKVVTYRPNHKQDNLTIDDTLDDPLRFSFTVLDTIDFRAGAETEYCNSFDPGETEAPWFPTNSTTYYDGNFSWEQGPPTNKFGQAHSLPNAWVTDLSTDPYPSQDSSSLLTPVFMVDSGQALEMSFWHWFNTENFDDGGNVEVSMDGGNLWQPIGYVFEHWYNTPFINALDIIRPGWSGSNNQWDSAGFVFSFEQDVQAIFRFRFESDYDNNYNGWAIDDFCLKHSTKTPHAQISTKEVALPKENIITNLSPNPTKGIAQLELYTPSPKKGSLVVISSVGQIMEQRDLEFSDGINTIHFDGSKWNSGMYIVKLNIDNEIITKKLIIAH